MDYYEKALQFNNGSSVVVSSYHLGSFKPQDSQDLTYYYFSEGVDTPSSPFSLAAFCPTNAISLTSQLIAEVMGTETPLTPEYMESDEYKELLATFDANVNWVWGSREKGGVFLAKHDSTTYSIYGVSGVYKINENYLFDWFGGVFFTQEELSDCILTVYDEVMHDEKRRFRVELLLRRHDTTPERYTIDVADFSIETVGSRPIYNSPYFAYSWNEVVSVFGFVKGVEFSQPAPKRIFRNFRPVQLWSGRDVSQFTYENGDWSGDNLTDVDNAGNSGYDSGDGDFNNDSDDVDPVDGNDITNDVLLSGFITLYRPTLAQIKSFNNFLFTNITDSIAEQIKRLQTNPLDYIVNISMCHFVPPSDIGSTITFAGISSGVSAPKISKQFITKFLGSVDLHEYFGTFLDYNPYTKCELYLPYIGIVPINIDDVQRGTVSIYYTIDLLTGSCIAQVKTDRPKRTNNDSPLSSVLYEFQGNCFLNVPLSGTNWQGTYQSIIQGISGIGQAIGGNVLGGAGQIASAVISEKVSCQRTGALQPAHGFMGKQEPYFILSRPIQNLPYNFKGFEGFTSNVRDRVKNLSGYTEIDQNTIWSDNFGHATQEECEMIKEIMNGGVYL